MINNSLLNFFIKALDNKDDLLIYTENSIDFQLEIFQSLDQAMFSLYSPLNSLVNINSIIGVENKSSFLNSENFPKSHFISKDSPSILIEDMENIKDTNPINNNSLIIFDTETTDSIKPYGTIISLRREKTLHRVFASVKNQNEITIDSRKYYSAVSTFLNFKRVSNVCKN